jgi:hypothetical protein
MIGELFVRFDGAFADNTLRANKSDFILYNTWCEGSEALRLTYHIWYIY